MSATTETPPLKSHIGERKKLRFPDGSVRWYRIADEITKVQSSNEQKYFCLQKLNYEDGDDEEIRFGYYIIGKKERMKGKWVWGQYCPLLPKRDFEEIIKLAIEKHWIAV
jgi:hypothetical protein